MEQKMVIIGFVKGLLPGGNNLSPVSPLTYNHQAPQKILRISLNILDFNPEKEK